MPAVEPAGLADSDANPDDAQEAEGKLELTVESNGKVELRYKANAFVDKFYYAGSVRIIDQIIGDLRSQNWYSQNPAIERIQEIHDESFPATAWFVLGRCIYSGSLRQGAKSRCLYGQS